MSRIFARIVFVLGICWSQASHANKQFYLEIPTVLKTKYTSAGSIDLKPGIGLGFSHFPARIDNIAFGYGALSSIYPVFWQGTDSVFTTGIECDLESRGYLALILSGTNISFWPYMFLGFNVEYRQTKIVAYESVSVVNHVDLGVRNGIGINIAWGDLALKMDGSIGYSFYGLNIRTWIILGFGIF